MYFYRRALLACGNAADTASDQVSRGEREGAERRGEEKRGERGEENGSLKGQAPACTQNTTARTKKTRAHACVCETGRRGAKGTGVTAVATGCCAQQCTWYHTSGTIMAAARVNCCKKHRCHPRAAAIAQTPATPPPRRRRRRVIRALPYARASTGPLHATPRSSQFKHAAPHAIILNLRPPSWHQHLPTTHTVQQRWWSRWSGAPTHTVTQLRHSADWVRPSPQLSSCSHATHATALDPCCQLFA